MKPAGPRRLPMARARRPPTRSARCWGWADRGRVLDLFEAIMGGDAPGALSELGAQYADGADPVAVLRDLAEITHWAERGQDHARGRRRPHDPARGTRAGAVAGGPLADAGADTDVADAAQGAGGGIACPQRHDGRRDGGDPPSPMSPTCRRRANLVKKLQSTPCAHRRGGARASLGWATGPVHAPRAQGRPVVRSTGGPQAALQPQPGPDLSLYPTFDAVVALIEQGGATSSCWFEVKTCLRLASYAPRPDRVPADRKRAARPCATPWPRACNWPPVRAGSSRP